MDGQEYDYIIPGRISAEGAIQLKERHGIKVGERDSIQLSKETIKLQDTKIWSF